MAQNKCIRATMYYYVVAHWNNIARVVKTLPEKARRKQPTSTLAEQKKIKKIAKSTAKKRNEEAKKTNTRETIRKRTTKNNTRINSKSFYSILF